jgi:CRP-like cAMP-binding protein
VVISGNFEIIRTTHNKGKVKSEVPRNLLGGARSMHTGGKISLRKKQKTNEIRISIVQKGQIFGHDDVVFDRPYTTSVKCVSNNGMLYMISAHEFYHKM